jgi:hypothetical protein
MARKFNSSHDTVPHLRRKEEMKKGREVERMRISEPTQRVSIINNKMKKSHKNNSLSIIEDTLY